MRRILLVSIVVFTPGSIYACSCATPTLEREIASASVIFVGTATHRANPTGDDDLAKITFDIHESWKLRLPKTFTVSTIAFGPACGYVPGIGGDFLVFAHRGKDGRFHVGMCSNNQPFACALPVLEKLGRPAVKHKPLPVLTGLGTDENPLPSQTQFSRCTTPPTAPAGADLALPNGVDIASFSATVLRDGRMRDVVLTVTCWPGAECPADLRARMKAKYEAVRYEPARWNGARAAMHITRAPAIRSPR